MNGKPQDSMLIACPSCSTAFRVSPKALGETGRSVRCAHCRNVWFATPDSMMAEPVAAEAPPAQPKDTAPAATKPAVPPAPTSPPTAPKDDWGASFDEELPQEEPAMPETTVATPPRQAAAQQDDDKTPALPRVHSPSLQPRILRGAVSKLAMPFNPLIRRKRRVAMPDRRGAKVSPWTMVTVAGLVILSGFIIGRQSVVKAIPGAANIYAMMGFPVNLRGVEFQNIITQREMSPDGIILRVEGEIVNLTKQPASIGRLRIAILDANKREIYTWTAVASKAKLEPYESLPFRTSLLNPVEGGKNVMVRFLTAADMGGQQGM